MFRNDYSSRNKVTEFSLKFSILIYVTVLSWLPLIFIFVSYILKLYNNFCEYVVFPRGYCKTSKYYRFIYRCLLQISFPQFCILWILCSANFYTLSYSKHRFSCISTDSEYRWLQPCNTFNSDWTNVYKFIPYVYIWHGAQHQITATIPTDYY